jgi:hypothetical protein
VVSLSKPHPQYQNWSSNLHYPSWSNAIAGR